MAERPETKCCAAFSGGKLGAGEGAGPSLATDIGDCAASVVVVVVAVGTCTAEIGAKVLPLLAPPEVDLRGSGVVAVVVVVNVRAGRARPRTGVGAVVGVGEL